MHPSSIYLTSAIAAEIAPTLDYCNTHFQKKDNNYIINEATNIKFLTHGIGLVATTMQLTQIAQQAPQLIIQAGIAGSFNRNLAIGNVYFVGADRIADLGAEFIEEYQDAYEMQLINGNESPYTYGWMFNTELPYPVFFNGLMSVNAISVNTVTGCEPTKNKWVEKYKPSLESMEGAALHYVCLKEKIPFVQIRAISNYVENRNKNNWNIPLAIENLNQQLIAYLQQLKQS